MERTSPFVLISRFIQNDLSDAEVNELLAEIEKDRKILVLLKRNLLADLLLKEKFRIEKEKGNTILNNMEDEISLPDFQFTDSASSPLLLPPLEYEKPITILQSIQKIFFTRKEKPLKSQKPHKESPYFALFLIFCICFLIGMFVLEHFRRESQSQDDFSPPAFARITELVNTQWEEGSSPCLRGEALFPEQEIRLKSGLIQIILENGVRQIFQGPSRFRLIGTNQTFCDFGNITVFVPPSGIGFTVSSPFGKAVDLGTEFQADITDQEMKVHVVQGEVNFVGSDGNPIRLFAQNALRAHRKTAPEKIAFDPKNYISTPDFHQRLASATDDLLRIREEQKKVLNRTPGLIFRCDFSKDPARKIPNEAFRNQWNNEFAYRTGCTVDEGAIYRTQAIKFSRKGDRIEFNLPKIDQSFSFDLSLRIDHLSHHVNTLFMSKRFYDEPGGFLWQVGKEGDLLFGISGTGIQSGQNPDSFQRLFRVDQAIKKSELGTWIRLTIVVDAQAKEIRHYKNGNLLIAEKWSDPLPPFNPGRIVLGNTANPKKYAGELQSPAEKGQTAQDIKLGNLKQRRIGF